MAMPPTNTGGACLRLDDLILLRYLGCRLSHLRMNPQVCQQSYPLAGFSFIEIEYSKSCKSGIKEAASRRSSVTSLATIMPRTRCPDARCCFTPCHVYENC